MKKNNSQLITVDPDMDVRVIVLYVIKISQWIDRAKYSKVYFHSCDYCGGLFSSQRRKHKFCNKSCAAVFHRKKRAEKLMIKPLMDTKTVKIKNISLKRRKWRTATGVIKHNETYVAKKYINGKNILIYEGIDFFECVCSLKSWEVKNANKT